MQYEVTLSVLMSLVVEADDPEDACRKAELEALKISCVDFADAQRDSVEEIDE